MPPRRPAVVFSTACLLGGNQSRSHLVGNGHTLSTANICACLRIFCAASAGPAAAFCPGGDSSPQGLRQGTSPIPCPENMTSPQGSVSQSQCVCKPGFGGATCQRCTEGTFSAGGDREECTACGPGATSMAGATSSDDCGCMPGMGGNDCTSCPRGFWSSSGVCKPCNAPRTSEVGAKGPEQCYCPPGTWGDDCAACSVGFFCPGKDAGMQPCDANRWSEPNAKAATECYCVAGMA
jgi:hypothetical protein